MFILPYPEKLMG